MFRHGVGADKVRVNMIVEVLNYSLTEIKLKKILKYTLQQKKFLTWSQN